MSLVSCQKQEFQPNPEGTTITVNATVEDPIVTKTYVEELEDAYAINWSESELNMQAFVWNESGYNKAESNEFTSNPDGTGTFNVTVPSGEWTNIAGIYPSSAVKETDEDTQTRMRTELPTIQNPSATSYDPAAYILIARPTALPESLEGFTWEAYYYRATALNKFMVTNLENGGNIVSVKITFPEGEKVSGYKRVNLTTAEVIEYSANNPNYVDLNYKAAPLAANEGGSYDLWFTTWTVNVPMESTGFTVEVTTEEYKYTKTFIPKQDGFVLEENAVNIVPVNMTGAEVEAIDPAEDFSGDYLIVSKKENNDGSWVYMSDIYTNNKYFTRGETNIPASREFSSLTTADFQDIDNIEKYVWTISKSSNGYIISNSRINDEGTKYLEPDDSENQAHCSDNEVSVYIEAGENGTVKIQANSSINRWLQYNGNKNQERFACYEGTQNEIYLLPWVESTDPALIVSEPSKTVSADEMEVTFSYTARNLTGKVTADEGSDPDDIISSISVNEEASTVTVGLIENLDEKEKTATVILSAESVEPVTLTITQRAKPAAGTKYYVKVTEEPADWSGQYLIVYEDASYAFDGSLSKLDAAKDYKKVTIDGAMIESTSETDAISFSISSIDGGYAIQSHSGYYIYNSSSTANALETSTDETGVNTISLENGSCKIVSSSTVLRFNDDSNQMRFRYYRSASYTNQKPIQLYKLQ